MGAIHPRHLELAVPDALKGSASHGVELVVLSRSRYFGIVGGNGEALSDHGRGNIRLMGGRAARERNAGQSTQTIAQHPLTEGGLREPTGRNDAAGPRLPGKLSMLIQGTNVDREEAKGFVVLEIRKCSAVDDANLHGRRDLEKGRGHCGGIDQYRRRSLRVSRNRQSEESQSGSCGSRAHGFSLRPSHLRFSRLKASETTLMV